MASTTGSDDPAVLAAYKERDEILAELVREANRDPTGRAMDDTVVPIYRIILDPDLSESEKTRRVEAFVAGFRAARRAR